MTVANFRRAIAALFVFVGAQHVLPLVATPLASAQSTSGTKSSANGQSRKETIHNPLNDYLDEAQRDIDKSDFTAAITPLQKFIAEKPEVAFAHFQLAYAYTALKQVPEARAEYEKAISLDPKMSEAYLNLGILLTDPAPADAVARARR
jgi:Flp pilus assembly protein TadD